MVVTSIMTKVDLSFSNASSIGLPGHVLGAVHTFRSALVNCVSSLPTSVWVYPLCRQLESESELNIAVAQPYVSSLLMLKKLLAENKDMVKQMTGDVQFVFLESINSLCLQLSNWLQHSVFTSTKQHHLFHRVFRSTLQEWEASTSSLLCLDEGGKTNMLHCLRANHAVLLQICAHINQVDGIRLQTLVQLCQMMEREMYLITTNDLRQRRVVDSILSICQTADAVVKRLERACAEVARAVVVPPTVAVVAPVAPLEAPGLTIAKAPVVCETAVVDVAHMRYMERMREIEVVERELHYATQINRVAAWQMKLQTLMEMLAGKLDVLKRALTVEYNGHG
jgi:hypothetical protein